MVFLSHLCGGKETGHSDSQAGSSINLNTSSEDKKPYEVESQPYEDVTAINPLQASTESNNDSVAKPSLMDSTVTVRKQDWNLIADKVFSTKTQKHNLNKTISRAIGGLIKGIV